MKISDKELIEDLKRVGDLLGKVPTGTEYEKHGKYSLFPYKSRKRWLEWCKECFEYMDIGFKQTLIQTNMKELEQDLLNVYDEIKRVPSKRDYIKYGQYSVQSYIRINSWSDWCKRLFPDFKKSNSLKIDEKTLISDLKRVREEIGHPPSIGEYKKYGKYSISVYWRVKSWKDWIKDIFHVEGGNVPDRISNRDLINNLRELSKKIGMVPKKKDLTINNGSEYSMNAYRRAFGSLENALLEAGMKPFFVRNKTEEEVIEDILMVYNKVGHTPTRKEYLEYSDIGYSPPIISKMFGSWTNLLMEAGIPVVKARKVSKQDVIVALNKWYEDHNNDKSCLEYWALRKARNNLEFPFSPHTIKSKFDKLPWEDIMKTIDATYRTKDPFVGRYSFIGEDGNIYLSSIEREVGNILFDLRETDKIKEYEYEAVVCSGKSWTCDFLIDKKLWVEVDGMRGSRATPYDLHNKKIEYYQENGFNYKIISYVSRDIKKSLYKILTDEGYIL